MTQESKASSRKPPKSQSTASLHGGKGNKSIRADEIGREYNPMSHNTWSPNGPASIPRNMGTSGSKEGGQTGYQGSILSNFISPQQEGDDSMEASDIDETVPSGSRSQAKK